MFLLEFNCCHKMLRLLKWWNSFRRALFCSSLILFVIVCATQHPSLPVVRNLLWSEGLCRNPKVENKVKKKKAEKQISTKKARKVKNSAFCSWLIKGTRQWLCGLYEASYISCTSEAPSRLFATEKRLNDFGFRTVLLIFYLKLARLRKRSIMYDTELQRKDFWQLSYRVCSSPKDSHPVGLRSSQADAAPEPRPFSVRWPGWNRWSAA